MSAEEMLQLMEQLKPYMDLAGWLENMIRMLMWWIVSLLAWIIGMVSDAYTNIFKIFDIFQLPEVKNLITDLTPIAWIIGGVSVAVWGMVIMFNQQKSVRQFFQTVVLGILIIGVTPVTFGTILTKTVEIGQAFNSSQNDSLVYKTISDNTYDLYVLGSHEYDVSESFHPEVTSKNIAFIDINETIDPKNALGKHGKSILESRLTMKYDGSLEVKKMPKDWLSGKTPPYYRYHIHFVEILAALVVLGVVYLLTSIKTARLAFEMLLAFSVIKIAALTNTSVLRKVLKNIGNTLLLLIFVPFSMYLFVMVSGLIGQLDANFFAKLLMQIAIGFAVIDGPYFIQELTGMDAGLKSAGFTALAAGAIIMKGGKALAAATKLPGAAKAGLQSGSKKLAAGGIGTAGFINGFMNPSNGTTDQLEQSVDKKVGQTPTASSKEKQDGHVKVPNTSQKPFSGEASTVDSAIGTPTESASQTDELVYSVPSTLPSISATETQEGFEQALSKVGNLPKHGGTSHSVDQALTQASLSSGDQKQPTSASTATFPVVSTSAFTASDPGVVKLKEDLALSASAKTYDYSLQGSAQKVLDTVKESTIQTYQQGRNRGEEMREYLHHTLNRKGDEN